jgi:hypothetical protein
MPMAIPRRPCACDAGCTRSALTRSHGAAASACLASRKWRARPCKHQGVRHTHRNEQSDSGVTCCAVCLPPRPASRIRDGNPQHADDGGGDSAPPAVRPRAWDAGWFRSALCCSHAHDASHAWHRASGARCKPQKSDTPTQMKSDSEINEIARIFAGPREDRLTPGRLCFFGRQGVDLSSNV